MPVEGTQSRATGKCNCCGSKTRKVTGTAVLENGDEALYIGQWTEKKPDHGMAFLVTLPGLNAFVSILYYFENGAFSVVGPDDYDWQISEGMRILRREEVIDAPLASRIFAFLDEIWVHDRQVSKFQHKWNKR